MNARYLLGGGAILLCSLGIARADERVDWTKQVNVAVRGNTVQKTGGCEDCDDAFAVSAQSIPSGNGYAEFTVGEPYTFWTAGLSRAAAQSRVGTIDYAIQFNGNGTADVLESGRYQPGMDIDYAAGDTFRIEVANGRIRYMKNGQVFGTSRQQPNYPLVLATSLGSRGATVRDARIESSNLSASNGQNGYGRYQNQNRSRYGSFQDLDRNGDGVITRNEWRGSSAEFNALDTNRDGVLTPNELSQGGYSNRQYGRYRGDRGVATAGQMITVPATERWTDTGVWVEAGDSIMFDAQGTIQMSDNPNDTATPGGSRMGRRAADAPLRSESAGSLIARIGNSAPMLVGNNRTVRAPSSGEIFLSVNDDYLQDNSGEFRVNISVNGR